MVSSDRSHVYTSRRGHLWFPAGDKPRSLWLYKRHCLLQPTNLHHFSKGCHRSLYFRMLTHTNVESSQQTPDSPNSGSGKIFPVSFFSSDSYGYKSSTTQHQQGTVFCMVGSECVPSSGNLRSTGFWTVNEPQSLYPSYQEWKESRVSEVAAPSSLWRMRKKTSSFPILAHGHITVQAWHKEAIFLSDTWSPGCIDATCVLYCHGILLPHLSFPSPILLK